VSPVGIGEGLAVGVEENVVGVGEEAGARVGVGVAEIGSVSVAVGVG
jgi:hypothetical protein